jgi:Flp pilus assembly protein TadD
MPTAVFAILLALLIPAATWADSVAGSATVLEVQGKAEFSTDSARWQAVKTGQKLEPGQSVRTGRASRLALLLSDRTQIRLNENTELDIEAVGPAPRSTAQSKFRQRAGRAWVQSKTPPKTLEWRTPTAIAGIRGTDWEMAVAEDGTSTLSVFSGEIDFANELGRVSVAGDEQAIAAPGRAPIKLTVRNLKDRIQWVTAYRVAPWRFAVLDGDSLPALRERLAGATAPAERGRILADLGRWQEAEQAFAAAGTTDAGARIGLAWAALRRNDSKAAGELLAGAESARDSEAWGYADAARLMQDGDFDAADASLRRLIARPDLRQATAWLLLSDIAAYEGRLDDALAEIDAGRARLPEDARLPARRAELLLLADRAAEAQAAADAAIDADLASYEGWLARARIARREGDANVALPAFDLAIALKPDDDRAWFGRGGAMAEREYVADARADLGQALALHPDGLGYQGELGTLESYADEYPAAEAAYRAALAANPADYVALTGLGVLDLKRGRPQAALDSLLKAGVMEPRYARAHVYTAVAYWQLGDVGQARSELARAGELDDKDPLPHFMAAMMAGDLLQPADAVASSRAAMQRLPYLKSLNQLANDQQGSANLGQAFAFMGLEEWARAYAQASYTPFWAGSHLFLADRYNGLYSKNSELFQGLIADPTAFGAGNRFQALVPGPARNLDLSLRYTRSDSVDGFSPQVQLSGRGAEPRPTAWYLAYEKVDWDLLDRPYELDALTAAFGVKPRHDLGLFLFADAASQDSEPVGDVAGLAYDVRDELDSRRIDLGFHYELSPLSQVWLKAGHFDSDETVAGLLDFSDIRAATQVELPEFGLRHSFERAGGHQISWGVDLARRATDSRLDDDGFFLRHDYRITERSTDLYLSDVYRATASLTLQADLFWQDQRRHAVDLPSITLFDPPDPGTPTREERDDSRLSPRLGLAWQPDARTWLRLAWQNWLRPAGMSTLGPVATAGIPLDDRLVRRGGELDRVRLQGEWEATPTTFVTGYLDHKEVENRRFGIRPFALTELESLGKLRPRDYGQLMRDDLYEFTDTPDYAGGTIRQAGLAVNHMLTPAWSLSARYVYSDSENMDDASLAVPYLARHVVALGATWVDPSGWYLAGRLAHRGSRYADEANGVKLAAGVSGDLDVFWQSSDKRWLLRFSANDLFNDVRDSQYTAELNYRF